MSDYQQQEYGTMERLRQLVSDAKFANNLRVAIFVERLEQAINQFDQSEGMRESFRKAASDLAIEAGVIAHPVKHDEAAGSVLQDVYFLQLVAESQLTMQRLSIRYEKLRAAAIGCVENRRSVSGSTDAMGRLMGVLDSANLHSTKR